MTRRLLDHYAHPPFRPGDFDAHAGEAQSQAAVEAIAGGQALALVSDAGTPLLSDPVSALVMRCAAAGVAIHPLPGPSALAGGACDGRPAGGQILLRRLPATEVGATAATPDPRTGDRSGALVFYEAPHRVAETLADLEACSVIGRQRRRGS